MRKLIRERLERHFSRRSRLIFIPIDLFHAKQVESATVVAYVDVIQFGENWSHEKAKRISLTKKGLSKTDDRKKVLRDEKGPLSLEFRILTV